MRTIMMHAVLMWAAAACIQLQFENPERSLHASLLTGYDTMERPAEPGEKVTVTLRLFLVDASGLDEANSHMTVRVWMALNWFDARLSWEPEHHSGMMKAFLPPKQIWTPDITMLNSVKIEDDYDVKLSVANDGLVSYVVPFSATVTCRHEFRTNSYQCPFKFGSWVYDYYHMDIRTPKRSPIEMDTSNFEPNDHWMVLNQQGAREIKNYPCCPNDRYATIEYRIGFRNKMGPSLMGRRRRRSAIETRLLKD